MSEHLYLSNRKQGPRRLGAISWWNVWFRWLWVDVGGIRISLLSYAWGHIESRQPVYGWKKSKWGPLSPREDFGVRLCLISRPSYCKNELLKRQSTQWEHFMVITNVCVSWSHTRTQEWFDLKLLAAPSGNDGTLPGDTTGRSAACHPHLRCHWVGASEVLT